MELSIGTIIKIILGLLVVVAVAYGLYHFFSNNISGSFEDIGLNTSINCFLSLL
jgi:flagellar biosynthesis protein FliR